MAAITTADIVTWVKARYSSRILIDLTNQDNGLASSIVDAVLDAAAEDGLELFDSLVGGEADDDHNHDKGACKSLAMVYLYQYAENSTYMNFHLTAAMQYMMVALKYRWSIDPIEPTNVEQNEQEFTTRAAMVQNLPSSFTKT